MPQTLGEFLSQLAVDTEKQQAYLNDAEAAMKKAGLDAEGCAALKSRNPEKIYAGITGRGKLQGVAYPVPPQDPAGQAQVVPAQPSPQQPVAVYVYSQPSQQGMLAYPQPGMPTYPAQVAPQPSQQGGPQTPQQWVAHTVWMPYVQHWVLQPQAAPPGTPANVGPSHMWMKVQYW